MAGNQCSARAASEVFDLRDARAIGDPPADEAFAPFAETVDLPAALLDALARLVHAGSVAGAGGRAPGPDGEDALVAWRRAPMPLPPWADRELIERGQQVFHRWGLPIATVLFTASLPWAYAAANGVQVLARLSDLSDRDIRRRIAETGQMLVDVHDLSLAETDEFDPAGRAVRTIADVRLVHAAVRSILLRSGGWDPAWGVPINQEDLAGTLLTFTVVVFDGLHRLGVSLSAADERAFLHLWAVVGHLLGIDHRLICLEVPAARRLRDEIATRQHAPSEAGRRIMAVLLAELERSMPRGFSSAPRTFVRHVAGAPIADLLGVGPAAPWGRLLRPAAAVGRVVTRTPAARLVAGWPGRLIAAAMFRMYIEVGLDGRPSRFRVDDDQMRRWRLATGERRAERRIARHTTRLPNRFPNQGAPS